MKRLSMAALFAIFIHGTLLVVEFPEPEKHLPKLSEFKTLNFSLQIEKPKVHKKENHVTPKPIPKIKKEPKNEKPVVKKPLPFPKLKKKAVKPLESKKKIVTKKNVVKKPSEPPPPLPVETAITETAEVPDEPPAPPITTPAIAETVNDDVVEKTTPTSHVIQEARPLYLENPPPHYPLIARKRRYEGMVMLEVYVDKEGNVADVRLHKSCGHRVLDKAALKSVRGWKFEPAKRGRETVSMWVRVPIRFRLKD